jgi:hypothetical protein
VGHVLLFWGKKPSPALPLGWWKNFGHHPMVWVCQMVIEFFWSPSNTP